MRPVCHCPNAHLLILDLGTLHHNLFSYVCPFAFYTTTYPFLAISTLALPSVHCRTSLCSRANGCLTVTMATPCLRVTCISSPRYPDRTGIFWVFVCRVFSDNNLNFQNVAPEKIFLHSHSLSFAIRGLLLESLNNSKDEFRQKRRVAIQSDITSSLTTLELNLNSQSTPLTPNTCPRALASLIPAA